MATANEVLILFTTALGAPSDSEEQATLLGQVRAAIEKEPAFIPVLYSTILSVVPRGVGDILKRWIADTVEYVVARLGVATVNSLAPEQKVHLTIQSLDAILIFLETTNSVEVQKLGIQCFATAYPLVFRHTCTSPSPSPQLWEKASRAKGIVLNLWRTSNTGLRVAAIKAVQRIIQSQTKGTADPRLQNRGDINLAMCPSHHPFLRSQHLEEEANKLVEEAFTQLYVSKVPDIVSSVINVFAVLVKSRPTLAHLIFGAFTNWTPQSLINGAVGAVPIRSVEKTLRLALGHLLRSGHGNAYAAQINEFLHRQDQRMRTAQEQEQRRKNEEASLKRARIADDLAQSGVGQLGAPGDFSAKRRRLDDPNAPTPPPFPANNLEIPPGTLELVNSLLYNPAVRTAFSNAADLTSPGGRAPPLSEIEQFRVATFPPSLMVELVVASLQIVNQDRLDRTVSAAKRILDIETGGQTRQGSAQASTQANGPQADGTSMATEEPAALDPLKLELDDDDLEGRARDAADREVKDKADLAAAEAEGASAASKADGASDIEEEKEEIEASGAEQAIVPGSGASRSIPAKVKNRLMHSAIGRICAVGVSTSAAVRAGGGDQDLWIQLISRLVTRGLPEDQSSQTQNGDASAEEVELVKKEKDGIRKQIFDFVTADIGERVELARLWLNEEWYTQATGEDVVPETQPYAIWLKQLIDFITSNAIDKDKTASFTQFIVDLPQIPKSELQRLARMCTDPAGAKVGFITLRDLAMLRPPLRQDAMDVVLSLATHADRATRGAAIVTVKRWVPDTQPLAQMGLDFALHLLHRLESSQQTSPDAQAVKKEETEDGMDTEKEKPNGEEEKPSTMAIVEHGQVTSGLSERPRTEADVAQHLELLFGLTSKAPNLLGELFQTYLRMSSDVQQIVQTSFAPLIRALGPNHPKIHELVSHYPAGSEDLVLRMLTVLTSQNGKLPAPLTLLIKDLAQERDLSPRFIVPIIAEFDKAEITRHLPRIIGLLSGKQAERELVRNVFQSVVTTPPQSFGSVTSNVPRMRQSELLTPVELLVLLHQHEKEIGLKQTIEAIGICFNLTEAFRPEVLGAFMQQVVDEPILPTLFLRTVIQAVTTYKSLVPYVSNTLLSRLITKKIWTTPQLWEGFIRCAKAIAPHSFGAILQLPRDQIRELVNKQPGLRDGLKEYVMKKAGTNKSRIQGLLEVLDSAPAPSQPAANATPTESPAPGVNA